MATDDMEFEFDDEQNVTPVGEETKIEKTVEPEDDSLDIEVEDDTPEADRGRKPLPKEKVEELENDDLTDYSERVKERMSQLRKVYHDERREKEAAAREREEAIRSYIEVAKQAADHEMALATKEYRDAYETADTDKLIEAQKRLNAAQMRLTQVQNYQPQYENALQQPETEVYSRQERAAVPQPDKKALDWQAKNDWFGRDEEMTSLALGLHEKLVRSGISPTSDDYYRRIDSTMRKRFPEYFEDVTLDEDKPAQRTKSPTVVAPATRSTAPKKVRLTNTQLALAKKLGLTPEQYAREALKLEKQNG
jgi:hypothetical protein